MERSPRQVEKFSACCDGIKLPSYEVNGCKAGTRRACHSKLFTQPFTVQPSSIGINVSPEGRAPRQAP